MERDTHRHQPLVCSSLQALATAAGGDSRDHIGHRRRDRTRCVRHRRGLVVQRGPDRRPIPAKRHVRRHRGRQNQVRGMHAPRGRADLDGNEPSAGRLLSRFSPVVFRKVLLRRQSGPRTHSLAGAGRAGGSHYLRVCLSSPGTAQPTIAANGSSSGATFGCINSALTAPLPPASGKAGSKERLSLPSAKKCLSSGSLRFTWRIRKYDPFKKVSVTIKRRKIPVARRGKYVVAIINLRGRPRGAFTVKIHATTVLGHTLSATRTYHTCVRASKPKPKHIK